MAEEWTSQNSCQKVRDSCRQWMSQQQHQDLVRIDGPFLGKVAQDILKKQQQSSTAIMIEWDEEHWHYRPCSKLSRKIATERLALYILAMDAINFCFWPSHTTDEDTDNFEYEHLAMAMARMAQQDETTQEALPDDELLSPEYVFSPSKMAKLTPLEMARLFEEHLTNLAQDQNPITTLDNMETRCGLWNEVGKVLLEKWEGNILKFLDCNDDNNGVTSSSGLTAPQLVDRITDNFPGFRDFVPGDNTTPNLYLYKRAQICVGDWNASLQLNLRDLDQVTTFADYRVPQLLRHFGVLQYGTALASTIDEEKEILASSQEENTIRAATVVAVEDLVEEIHRLQQREDEKDRAIFTAVTVDWYLWQLGEKMHNEGTLKPHHRTRTTFY